LAQIASLADDRRAGDDDATEMADVEAGADLGGRRNLRSARDLHEESERREQDAQRDSQWLGQAQQPALHPVHCHSPKAWRAQRQPDRGIPVDVSFQIDPHSRQSVDGPLPAARNVQFNAPGCVRGRRKTSG